MGFWKKLFGIPDSPKTQARTGEAEPQRRTGEAEPWAILSCDSCHRVYRLGDDAVVASLEHGFSLGQGAIAFSDGSAAEREDLVSALQNVEPDTIQTVRDRARPSWEIIRMSLLRGDRRRWRCHDCNAVNTFPPELRTQIMEPLRNSIPDLYVVRFRPHPLLPHVCVNPQGKAIENLLSVRIFPPREWAIPHNQAAAAALKMRKDLDTEDFANTIQITSYRRFFDSAEVNVKDSDGNTPLHFAVRDGRKDIVELLLASGADANATNKAGSKPLEAAMHSAGEDLTKLLLDWS